MIISLKKQALNSRVPLNCVSVYTGSALVLEITHLRMFADLGTLKQVLVEVTNVAGNKFTAEALLIDGTIDHYGCSFGAADFPHSGFVGQGLKITLMISPSNDSEVVSYVAGVGDFEVLKVRDDDKPTPSIDPLDEKYSLKQVHDKVNEIITAIAGKSACLVAALMMAFGAGAANTNAVYTASMDELMNDAQVVTNVAFGDVSFTETDPNFTSWKGGAKVSFPQNSDAVIFGGTSLQALLDSAGAHPVATATVTALAYQSAGTAIAISIGANGVMMVDLDGWIDGQAQTAFITLATGATVNSSIKLVGYSDWPRDAEFAASVLRRGDKVYVVPLFGVGE